jgi:hypothetical protein
MLHELCPEVDGRVNIILQKILWSFHKRLVETLAFFSRAALSRKVTGGFATKVYLRF